MGYYYDEYEKIKEKENELRRLGGYVNPNYKYTLEELERKIKQQKCMNYIESEMQAEKEKREIEEKRNRELRKALDEAIADSYSVEEEEDRKRLVYSRFGIR